ncbi:MAG: hypothetical protein GEU26_06445 [Nitrososphaeraceae archaeon]|nr:hypothetical protein [Nitrososphaeraceae archaeon]
MSKDGDIYLFPSLPFTSPLAHTGLHTSFHASGQSRLWLNYPLSCLHVGPKITAPFSRTQFVQDIIAKKISLFTEIDISNEHKAGMIAVFKIESATVNFLNSQYINYKSVSATEAI